MSCCNVGTLRYSMHTLLPGAKMGTLYITPGNWLFSVSACMLTRELRMPWIVQEAYYILCFIAIYIRNTLHNLFQMALIDFIF